MSMRIMVTGGTGFIGREIVFKLIERGDLPVIVTRNASIARDLFGTQVELESWDTVRSGDAMVKVEKVINLAGAPVAGKRWTEQYKQEVYDSRVISTRALVIAMEAAEKPPRVLVSASAVGIYGSNPKPGLNEQSPLGDDFLAKLCQDWEAAALHTASFGTRVSVLRTGVVLGVGGGALPKLAENVKRRIGVVGPGDQWVSWIDLEDLVRLYLFALDNDNVTGVLNATSPTPVSMRTLTDKIGAVMGRKAWLKVPDFAVKAVLGEGAQVVLEGQSVLPKRTAELGFEFQHRSLEQTLKKYLSV